MYQIYSYLPAAKL